MIAVGRSDAVTEWVLRVTATLVGTVVAVTSEVMAAFLTPFRIGDVLAPVSWVVVVVGAVAGVVIARYGSGTLGATAFPAVAWFVVFWPLSSPTDAGDVVVPGTWVGYGVLLLGLGGIAAALLVTVVVPRARRASAERATAISGGRSPAPKADRRAAPKGEAPRAGRKMS